MQAATRVVNLVEHDLRHQTIQKAAQEMEKVVELSDGQQECLLEAKQKAEIEELRGKVQEATRLREAAESQLVDLEVDYGPAGEQSLVVLPDDSQAAFDLSGSQATFERLPGTTRKRKGSEEDLAWHNTEQASDADDSPPRAAPSARKQVLKAVKPKAPSFFSDWSLPTGQVQAKGAPRMLQPSTSANSANPIALDRSGKPLKPVQVGSRKRMRGIS
ncbi:uncharacterized protein TRAVEDRAFT_71982 [Trametes versicolor FP-101664 SS1]|uniref:uncharacterized protein n=1 Tax=Trametes versicolor (strain FP-101664) TaxID=717944 RepID=UPI00046230A1|nr:uncharacterized protein TRAVEDRAFT_71982 [Trametes versicolor FP-101664 SS1]EIW58377.1 hypothetical protein TRAVEDRAFT_71982 [Trametes versicolor FP-101664 SS1]